MKNQKTSNVNGPILVIGGTGKTGGRVVERLKKRGVPVRIGSRSANPAFDWDEVSSWKPALKDVEAVYIAFYPDLAMPGATEYIRSFSKLAAVHRIKKIVLLSGRGESEAQQCEQELINTGLNYTIVRASWFCQNFSEGNFLDPVLSGHVFLPAGNVPEPFVDVDDIADVAVAALTEDGHNGQVYEVSGPRMLTFRDAVAEIARASGRNITYAQIPMGEYVSALKEYGVEEEIISLITYLFSEVLDGRNASLTDGVQRAIGRQPTDFSEFARKAAATGVWNRQPVVS